LIRCVRDGRATRVGPRGRRSIHCEFTMIVENFVRRRRGRQTRVCAAARAHPCPPLTRTLRLAVRDIGALPLGVVRWTIPQRRISGQRSWRPPTLERRRSSKDFACESQVHGAWCTSRATVALGPAPHRCTALTSRPSSPVLVCVQRLDEHVGCCHGADSLARRRLG
jgi:hypothetical protein